MRRVVSRSFGIFPAVVLFAALTAGLPRTVPASPPESTPASPPSAVMDEMVVTATRRPTDIKSAPGVITVITEEEIAQTPATNLAEVLAIRAGVQSFQPQQAGIVTPQDIRLRGVSGTERVLLLVDGQPFDDPYTNFWYFSLVPLEAVRRIEIARGPYSSQYGTGALGGVIQVFTKDGSGLAGDGWGQKGAKPGGAVETRVRGGDFGRMETVVTGQAGDNERASFFLSWQNAKAGNYYLNDSLDGVVRDGTGNRDLDQNRGHFHGRVQPTDELTLHVSGGYFDSKSGFGVSPLTGVEKQNEEERWYLNGNGTYQLTRSLDLFFGADYLFRKRPTDSDVALDLRTAVNAENLNEDSRLRGNLGAHWEVFTGNVLTVGGEVSRLSAIQAITDPVTGQDLPVFFRPPDSLDTTETNYAAYIQDEWTFLEDFTLIGGLRYDAYGDADDFLSPRGSLVWRYVSDGRVKLSAARASRSPSISDRKAPFWNLTVQQVNNVQVPPSPVVAPGLFAVSFNANPDLKNEELDSYEISFENEFLGKTLSTRLTPFYVKGRDFISTTSVTDPRGAVIFRPAGGPFGPAVPLNLSTLTTPRNIDRIEVTGFEGEARWQPIEHLTLFANYLYQYAKDEETDQQLNFYPFHTISEGAEWYSRHFGDAIGFTLGLYGRHSTSYRYVNLGGRERGEIPGFNVFDGRIGLDFLDRRLGVFGEVYNLANTDQFFHDTQNKLPERNYQIGAYARLEF